MSSVFFATENKFLKMSLTLHLEFDLKVHIPQNLRNLFILNSWNLEKMFQKWVTVHWHQHLQPKCLKKVRKITMMVYIFHYQFIPISKNNFLGDSVSFRQYGFSNADISSTLLDSNCPAEPRCNFNNKYRFVYILINYTYLFKSSCILIL